MTSSRITECLLPRSRIAWLGAMLLAVMGVSGCVYSIPIQQGNFLEAKDLDRVTVGMTRVQVRALLGTPMVADPFQNHRWDYVYYLKGLFLKKPVQRNFTVYFEEDKVVRIERTPPAETKQAEAESTPAAPAPAPKT